MSRYLWVAALVIVALASSGCARNRCGGGWAPSWWRESCDACTTGTTAYDPATPYFEGGYSAEGAMPSNPLPAPIN